MVPFLFIHVEYAGVLLERSGKSSVGQFRNVALGFLFDIDGWCTHQSAMACFSQVKTNIGVMPDGVLIFNMGNSIGEGKFQLTNASLFLVLLYLRTPFLFFFLFFFKIKKKL